MTNREEKFTASQKSENQSELNVAEIAILVTLIIIAILLAGLILTLKQNRKNDLWTF